jgi:hypothetical protein
MASKCPDLNSPEEIKRNKKNVAPFFPKTWHRKISARRKKNSPGLPGAQFELCFEEDLPQNIPLAGNFFPNLVRQPKKFELFKKMQKIQIFGTCWKF